jgi:hypothetical protein
VDKLIGIKWIEISKRLPPKTKIVLITNGHSVGIGFMGFNARTRKEDKGNPIFFRPVCLDPIRNIIAWANIPCLPREIKKLKKRITGGY